MAWNALGFTYLDLRRCSDAARAFQHAVDEPPRQSNYWSNPASAYSWAGRPDLASRTLERRGRNRKPGRFRGSVTHLRTVESDLDAYFRFFDSPATMAFRN